MQLTVNSLTALRLLRAIRTKTIRRDLRKRCDFIPSNHGTSQRLTRELINTCLADLGTVVGFSEGHPLDILVAQKDKRIRTKGVSCTFRKETYPRKSFINLGNGIVMSGPELLFVELARVMDPTTHLLLGMELCGRFSRSPEKPHIGPITYNVEPVTTVEKLRGFAVEAHWIRGAQKALATVDRIVENAWSPMEALLAALLVLPADELGYDLWPITLNKRLELDERVSRLGGVNSRVPDIMFNGTHVGLNYDGEDHFRLGEVARTAIELDRHPGDASYELEHKEALAECRRRIVEDKRRDRDLMALGLTVFSVTKEDLEGEGGLDRVMLQVIETIEDKGRRNLSFQLRMMKNQSRAAARQELIWSLMPGPQLVSARKRLEERKAELKSTREFEIEFETEDGHTTTISLEEL